ncbi:MAG: hypothetical protein HYV07_29805 [Deltaproteobacteria bacterium]|nr:hypothetical protein [Deltaproteobacteria bacterium]
MRRLFMAGAISGLLLGCGEDLNVMFELAETATLTSFPATLKLRASVAARPEEIREVLGTISFAVWAGSNCRISSEPKCETASCVAEVEIQKVGICVVRADAFTAADERASGCWFIANFPPGEYEANKPTIDRMYAECYAKE